MRKTTTGALAALILLTVSGCAAGGSTDGATRLPDQSVPEACDIAVPAAEDADGALTEALSRIDDEDYAGASETIRSATDDLDASLATVTNERVRDELDDLTEDMKEVGLLIDQMQAAADDAPLLAEINDDLVDDTQDVRESADELAAVCS
ncbi:hypothetical protein NQ166_10330 [Microbacterium sp. zg.Y1090]|uniref:hypothetical protein n=1 Tax=Microbacterium TaxID=33882 RepID=UPI00214CC618|nr:MULTISPECIES: hypothetical protein [unclassified Microbacterium]MCR2813946.1 hypothetical protein [Microbacterium sp. zg.Y1084]MCR2819220.1 hypothetical protein [Microbacterium sp. zg.Y1090]MDL5487137.1 hypothetical protein [Microbacterium sp. zg-Y1211]WIM28203.1 hypothetical protein QNO26_13830 [Microbacterium sp. zg-Y1090]